MHLDDGDCRVFSLGRSQVIENKDELPALEYELPGHKYKIGETVRLALPIPLALSGAIEKDHN